MTQKNILFRIAIGFISIFSFNQLNAQATTTVTSSRGYSVQITLTPKSIIAPNSCQWGYNYNTEIEYNITFSGNNIPNGLNTLQTNLNCNNQANFTSLPLSGETGVVTTHSNPYNNASDCGTASISSLNCNSFNLIIQGPGISNRTIYMPNNIALPVKFSALDVKTSVNVNEIYWSTSFEINNDFFSVERSNDGETWSEIESVKAGQSNGIQNYSVTDSKPFNGMNFYRIKQQDLDGNISYSNTITNTFNAPIQVSIFPNPSQNFFKVESNDINDMNIQIINGMGQVIQLNSNTDSNTRTFDVSELNAGIYHVQINLNGTTESHTLTVSK